MGTTSDPNDPRLHKENWGPPDEQPVKQLEAYLVLSEEERAKGFVRPYRDTYLHKTCGTTTKMSSDISATYARNPKFYGATYCVHCMKHRPLTEFVWDGTDEQVGS